MFKYVCKNDNCSDFDVVKEYISQRKTFPSTGGVIDKTAPCPKCKEIRDDLSEKKAGFATTITGKGFGNTCNK